MIKTIKIQLCPNNYQQSKLFQTAGAARFVYNWAIGYEKSNYEQGNKFINNINLRRIFTIEKKSPELSWLNDYSNDATKQAIKDACLAYRRFFEGKSKFPRFKSKRHSKPSFYVDTDKIIFTQTHVKLEKLVNSRKSNRRKLNWVRLAECSRIPINAKYSNPRITYDGLHWWLSIGIDTPDNVEIPTNDGIGIDLGIKDLAICSDGNIYKNINKSQKLKKLAKKKRRLQRKISKKYQINKKGVRYQKTRNIIKSEKRLLEVSRKLTNIRQTYIQQTTSEIVNRKPKFIVIEDLNVSGMMKNRHLAKAVQDQSFYEFRRILTYKCEWNNITLIVADRFFPSSKTCSCCGSINHNLMLKDRVFVCPECGFMIDRDFQAAINLANYGKIKSIT